MEQDINYANSLAWIHGLGRFGIKPGLERVRAMLAMLDNPQQKVRFVHIAGTNGKGSTAAMLASVLRVAGFRVGLYTSPYLLSFTNRMAVNNHDIGRHELTDLVGKVKPIVETIRKDPALGQPTEFEVVTALALTYFAYCEVDLVVLEVGLGGRLDATNVVTPLLSIITNISLEHTDVLGDTIEAIAGEKAGIIKPGVPLVTAAEDQEALNVFQKRCAELACDYHRVYPPLLPGDGAPSDYPVAVLNRIQKDGQFFDYHGFNLQLKDLFIRLRGKYQLLNAATVLAAIELLAARGFTADHQAIQEGLAQTSWPGRLELMQEKPLLIMDGAHNPAAMEKLAEAVPRYFEYRRLILVLGMLADKDIAGMLGHILPLADIVIFTRPTLPRAAAPQELAAYALAECSFAKEYHLVDNYQEALDLALELAEAGDAVLVTGSLYTVSDIRAYYSDLRRPNPG